MKAGIDRALGDGRLVVAGALGLFVVSLWLRDWYWPRFGVPGGTGFEFLDLQSITSGWECTRDGIDVLPSNPCDPLERPANYPRIWLAPASLGLGEESTLWLGAVTALAFFAAAFAVIGNVTRGDALVYAAAFCSPAVMLGVERGNADLLVFVVVVAALLAFRRGNVGRLLAHGLLLFAAVLKLFPVFAWGVLLRQTRWRALAGLGAVCAAFGAYALATLDDIRTIRAVVPQEVLFSYGAGVFDEGPFGRPVALAVGAAVALALVAIGYRRRTTATEGAREEDLDAFCAGAGVFVATFALFHNFNYRLVFLLLAVPALLAWSKQERPRVPLPALGLTALLLSLWLSTSLSFFPLGLGERWEDVAQVHAYDELVNMLLAGYLAAGLVLTLPDSIRILSFPGLRRPPGPRAGGRPADRSRPARTSGGP